MQTQIYVGLSGQLALQQKLDVLANNVANVNTVGFRGEQTLFDTYLEKAQEHGSVAYVVDKFSYTNQRAGDYKKTGNALDVAINGDAWLQVQTPNGTRFTRDGRLNMGPTGTVVNHEGYPVLDAGGAQIQIPNDAGPLQILKDGSVGDTDRNFGRIGLVRLPDPGAMSHEAGGLYVGGGQPVAATDAELLQGTIEMSNVNAVVAMTQLVELSNAYQQSKALVESGDETTRNAVRTLGRVD